MRWAYSAVGSGIGRLNGGCAQTERWVSLSIFLGEPCSSRQENEQLRSLIPGYFCRKALSLWPSAVIDGLTAFCGGTAAPQILLSPTGLHGSVFEMSRLLPDDKRGSQCGVMPGPEEWAEIHGCWWKFSQIKILWGHLLPNSLAFPSVPKWSDS